MTAIIALVSGIVNKFSAGSNEVQNGAAAVRQAIGEVEGLQEADFTAVLGEPEIVDNGNVFFTDPKVAVPVKESPYDSFDRLMFDLPRGRTDEESTFFELLDFFGLDFETMEQLEDGMIPVFYALKDASISTGITSIMAKKKTRIRKTILTLEPMKSQIVPSTSKKRPLTRVKTKMPNCLCEPCGDHCSCRCHERNRETTSSALLESDPTISRERPLG